MIKWYFRHLDDFTNEVIAKMGDGVYLCEDRECRDLNGKECVYTLWAVTTEKAVNIWNSRNNQPLKFQVFRQIRSGPIRQMQSFITQPVKRPGGHKFIPPQKGRPPVIFTGAALLALGRRGRERAGKKYQLGVH